MKEHRDMFAFWTGFAAGYCSLTESGLGGMAAAIIGLITLYLWCRSDQKSQAKSAPATTEKEKS